MEDNIKDTFLSSAPDSVSVIDNLLAEYTAYEGDVYDTIKSNIDHLTYITNTFDYTKKQKTPILEAIARGKTALGIK